MARRDSNRRLLGLVVGVRATRQAHYTMGERLEAMRRIGARSFYHYY